MERLTGTRIHISELRKLYDRVESHLRSLLSLGIDSEHYGAMLIPVILEKLPSDIRLEISRKMGTRCWKINVFMEILKEEIVARENCDYSTNRNESNNCNIRGMTTQALVANNRVLKCAFCRGNHYHDKCSVVTDAGKRKQFVLDNRLCFKCLMSNHNRRSCRNKNNCFRCRSSHHHTAICDKDGWFGRSDKNATQNDPNRQDSHSQTMLVNDSTSVYLQIASTIIYDNAEKK